MRALPTTTGRRLPPALERKTKQFAAAALDIEYDNYVLSIKDDNGNIVEFSEHTIAVNGEIFEGAGIDLGNIKSADPKDDKIFKELRQTLPVECEEAFGIDIKPKDYNYIGQIIVSYNRKHPKPEEEVDNVAEALEEIPMEYRIKATMLKESNEHTQYLIDTMKLKVLEQDDVIPFRIVLHYSVLTDRVTEGHSSKVLHPVASADSSGGKTHMESTLFELTPEQYVNTFGRDFTLPYISRETLTKGAMYMFRHYNRFGDMGNAEEHNLKDPMIQMKKAMKSENRYKRGLTDTMADNTQENVELELIGGGQIIEEETEVKGEEQEENRVVRWNPNCGVNTRHNVQTDTDNVIKLIKNTNEFTERREVCRAIIDSNFVDLASFEEELMKKGFDYEILPTTPMNAIFTQALEAYKYSGGLRFKEHPKNLLSGLVASNILNKGCYIKDKFILIFPSISDFKYIMENCYKPLYLNIHRNLLDLDNKLDDLNHFVENTDLEVYELDIDPEYGVEITYEDIKNNYFTIADWAQYFNKGNDNSSRNSIRNKLHGLSNEGWIKTFNSGTNPAKYVITPKFEHHKEVIAELKQQGADTADDRYKYEVDYEQLEADLKAFYAELEQEGYFYAGTIQTALKSLV